MNELTLQWVEAGQLRTETIRDQQPSKHPGTIRIGRDPAQCDIVLQHPSVSALHVEILFYPPHNSFYVRNLRENNPLLVDGQPILTGEMPLHLGSRFRLGQMEEIAVAGISLAQQGSAPGFPPTPPATVPVPIPPVQSTPVQPPVPPSPQQTSAVAQTGPLRRREARPASPTSATTTNLFSDKFLILIGIFIVSLVSGVFVYGFIQSSRKASNSETFATQSSATSYSNSTATKTPPGSRSTSNPFDTVPFPLETCSDSFPTDPNSYPLTSYPVYIKFSDRNFQTVKTSFCADALKKISDNGEESILVGSFTSPDRAEDFRDFMQATVGSGEVGNPSTLQVAPNKIGSSPSPSPTDRACVTKVDVNNPNSNLNVRSGPSTSERIVGKLKKGEVISVLSEKGDWLEISSPVAGYVIRNKTQESCQ